MTSRLAGPTKSSEGGSLSAEPVDAPLGLHGTVAEGFRVARAEQPALFLMVILEISNSCHGHLVAPNIYKNVFRDVRLSA